MKVRTLKNENEKPPGCDIFFFQMYLVISW